MNAAELTSLGIYLAAMLGTGLLCYRLTGDLADYILGGRRLGAMVAALSAGASDMSGWLLLGLPGALYSRGWNQLWIAIGLTVGAFLNWQFVAARLRSYTERYGNALTLPDYFENRFGDRSRGLRLISAGVILLFFAVYTSSGLVGGAILFEQTLGVPYGVALWIGAVIIVSYTFLGGFLAVSWTDFFQGSLMLVALIVTPIMSIRCSGGWAGAVSRAAAVDPRTVDALAEMSPLGIISLLGWGLGYFGQPHILARFMAIRSPDEIPRARLIGMCWMVLCLYGAMLVGFAGIAHFTDAPLANPETVFIALARELATPWLSGVLLAAILAAIMSTVDSQLLVCSSVLAEDFYRALLRPRAGRRELVWVGRGSVLAVAAVALGLAANPKSAVLDLVAYAWAGFGAAFGPAIVLSLFWRRMTRNGAMAGLVTGAMTVLVWKQLDGGIFDLYEMVPGFLFATLAIVLASLIDRPPQAAGA